ncbi:TonB-dependent siderophore receptor [Stutzerimonas nitrititolerans]|uniref:TonB-dependent siderophore receptor n=1 Tax=Stutzerimonas nitrititolerans TaxID=2482751 RepID=UPI0028AD39EE|nr:TonB-dependent siderophore receptor [Stutzerimonas nitrititolerans]
MDRTTRPFLSHRSRHWLLVGLLAPFPLSALAQSVAPQDEPVQLESITVEGNRLYDMPSSEESGGYTVEAATVGTKTPAALRDIPQSITVYTDDYIKDRQFVNLDDLAKYTAGLRTLTNDSGRSSIYARGYEYDEFNINGLPAPMASINGTVPMLAPFDRVEIMRGPSGLFNSTSEMGGIVNMVLKRPTRDFQGSVTGRYGSFDTSYLETDLSGALTPSGNVRGRTVLAQADTNGEVDYNANTAQNFYGALEFDLTDSTMLSLALLHQKKDITPHNGYPTDASGNLLNLDRDTFLGADWNHFDGRTTDLIGELTHRFDNGGFGRVAVRSSKRDTEFYYAFTGGKTGVDALGNIALTSTARDLEQDALALDASYSQPFETFGQVSEFVVGTDYKRYDGDYYSGNPSLGSTNIHSHDPSNVAKPAVVYTQRVKSLEKEFGLYSKLTFRPVERLALIGGARVSWFDGDTSTTTLANGARTNGDVRENAKITPYGGLVFDLDQWHSLYASYSKVFKPQTNVDVAGDVIDPREGEQYEVGVKGSYFGGALNTRLSLFQLTDENRAARDQNNLTGTYYLSIGEARIRGGEIEISGNPLPGWELIGGYTYMDTDIIKGDANAVFALMPQNQFSLWSNYELQGGPLTGLGLGTGITGMSHFQTATGIEAPGYAVVDAKLSYPLTPKLTATFDANNVFDREYYSRVGGYNTFNFYGPSRTFLVGARYEF